MGNMMPCFLRDCNSALNLSLSDMGTLHDRWTNGGILGSMFIKYSSNWHHIPSNISGNSFRTCSCALRFCLGDSYAAVLLFGIFQPFADSTRLGSSVCTTRFNFTKPSFLGIHNTISICLFVFITWNVALVNVSLCLTLTTDAPTCFIATPPNVNRRIAVFSS